MEMILRRKSTLETSIQEHVWKLSKKSEFGIWTNTTPSCPSQFSEVQTLLQTAVAKNTELPLPTAPEGGFLPRSAMSPFSSCPQVPVAEAKSGVNEGERWELLSAQPPLAQQRIYCGCDNAENTGALAWSPLPQLLKWWFFTLGEVSQWS